MLLSETGSVMSRIAITSSLSNEQKQIGLRINWRVLGIQNIASWYSVIATCGLHMIIQRAKHTLSARIGFQASTKIQVITEVIKIYYYNGKC